MNDRNKNVVWRGWIGCYYEGEIGNFKYTECHNDDPPILFKLKRNVIADPMAHWGKSPPLKAEPVVLITRDEYKRLKELDNE